MLSGFGRGVKRAFGSETTADSVEQTVIILTMHIPGSWILLIFAVLLTVVILLVLHFTKLGRIIHQQIPDRPQRRMFLASVSFFFTFLAVRLLVRSITHHVG